MPFIDRTPILRRLDQDLPGIQNLQKTFPTLAPMLFRTDVTSSVSLKYATLYELLWYPVKFFINKQSMFRLVHRSHYHNEPQPSCLVSFGMPAIPLSSVSTVLAELLLL